MEYVKKTTHCVVFYYSFICYNICEGDFMKLKLDDIVKPELKEFLLSQEGITQADLNYDNYLVELSIKHNKETTPNIIMKYIELFENTKFSNVFEFDKENIKNLNEESIIRFINKLNEENK